MRCLVVPDCTDGGDILSRRHYLRSIGVADNQIAELAYNDYARSKHNGTWSAGYNAITICGGDAD